MAFKMNRPVIKGTASHKASIAKAKSTSIVAAAEQGADSTLVAAGKELGLSNVGQSIDFGIESTKLDFKRKKGKKKKKKEGLTEEEFNELMKEDDDDDDFSGIEDGAKIETGEVEPYTSPDPGTKGAEERARRIRLQRAARRNKAAKKHNIKVEDLEAKEINGKREFFPKEGAVGGSYGAKGGGTGSGGTQWSDELGRFRIPTGGVGDKVIANLSPKDKEVYDAEMERRASQEEAEFKASKPKTGNVSMDDINTQQIITGNVRLNPKTNTYEYTDVYRKTKATTADKKLNSQTPSLPLTTTSEKPKQSDFRDKKNPFGGLITTADQQKKALKAWYAAGNTDSLLKKRDDRIWNGAIKGGKVHENMRKSGYIPRNEI